MYITTLQPMLEKNEYEVFTPHTGNHPVHRYYNGLFLHLQIIHTLSNKVNAGLDNFMGAHYIMKRCMIRIFKMQPSTLSVICEEIKNTITVGRAEEHRTGIGRITYKIKNTNDVVLMSINYDFDAKQNFVGLVVSINGRNMLVVDSASDGEIRKTALEIVEMLQQKIAEQIKFEKLKKQFADALQDEAALEFLRNNRF